MILPRFIQMTTASADYLSPGSAYDVVSSFLGHLWSLQRLRLDVNSVWRISHGSLEIERAA